MTALQKDGWIIKGLLGYVALSVTVFGTLVSVVFADMRSNIKANADSIVTHAQAITDLKLTTSNHTYVLQQHTDEIKGLLDLYHNQPTFRQGK